MSSVRWIESVRSCPICGGSSHSVLGTRGGPSHHAGAGVTTTIVRCRQCHGVYPRPQLLPTSNPYDEHTTEEYFHDRDAGSLATPGYALAQRAASLMGRQGRLLELGCGPGDLLLGAARAGWSVRGVEMTETFGLQARQRGIEVELASVADCRSLGEKWDAIFLSAVLEHLYEPRACLSRVYRALAPGGVVFIAVPNECGLWTRAGNAYMRLRGRSWAVNLSPTFPPYHVVGFCPRSLRFLALDVGFEVLELKTDRWPSELPVRRSLCGHLETLGVHAALTVGAWIGSGAGISAWLRRPPGSDPPDAR